MLQIIGNPTSPYVRKVLTVLLKKGIDFEIDPIMPLYGDDKFTGLSPLRRIPVLTDGEFVVNDSSVIIQYLEDKYPERPILPTSPAGRARARWFEEYADTRLGDVFVWKGFSRMVISPGLFGVERDIEAFRKLIDTDVAEVTDYVESQIEEGGYLAGVFGLADISVASMFRMMKYARWTPDAARWPRVTDWLARCETDVDFAKTGAWSDAILRARPEDQRAKAIELGLKVTADSRFGGAARRGPMTQIDGVEL